MQNARSQGGFASEWSGQCAGVRPLWHDDETEARAGFPIPQLRKTRG